jgi:hypothetical protein
VPCSVAVVFCEPEGSFLLVCVERVLQSSGEIRTVLRDDVEVITDLRPRDDP